MSVHHHYQSGWKDCSENQIFKNTLKRFSNFVLQTSELPFFLFIDDSSDTEKILHHLDFIPSSTYGSIIIVHKCGVKNLWQLWNNTPQILHDIIEWTNEEELIAYAHSLATRNNAVNEIINSTLVQTNLIGKSGVWKAFLRNIVETALFSTGSVLLIGESGTGKELISRLIHTVDKRPNKKDIVLLDCTTIVPELSGSEFFGHERGSYTNAHQSREGVFSMANSGTLFLDEVGELPLLLQAELLRVIQEGTYKKVGSNSWQKTAFRLVCATNRNLAVQVKEGRFRQDLYFRLADFEFRVPPLRERKEDIPLLARHFLVEFLPGKEDIEFEDSVMEYLMNREYLGNVRELRQQIRRIALKHVEHNKITMGEIPLQDRVYNEGNASMPTGETLRSSLRKAILSGRSLCDLKNMTMEEAIQIALDLSNGNKEQAAKKLGVTWRAILQFRKKMG